jgi:uncharacterized protein
MYRLSLLFMIVPLGLAALLHWVGLRGLMPSWGRKSYVVRATLGGFALIVVNILIFLLVRTFASRAQGELYLSAAWVLVLGMLATGLALPVAAFMRALAARALVRRQALKVELPATRLGDSQVGRRGFLVDGVTVLAPAIAATATASGVVEGHSRTRLKPITLVLEHLPRELDGFKILHLSDLHLGATKSHRDLAEVLDAAQAAAADLVVVTGDIADDDHELQTAMGLLEQFTAPLGVYASLGNHEYLNGIHRQRGIIERSKIPLLVNRGTHREHRSKSVYIAGIDDPMVFDSRMMPILAPWVRAAAQQAGNASLKILLSHRPQALDEAAEMGFHLVLSGHTHGGQLGMFGRSVLEWLWPSGLWWGSYTKRAASGHQTQLYTTSGFGDWFPFRFGCPTEAPLITLRCARD